MLKKYTTNQIKVGMQKCSKCGKKITIAHVKNGEILCAECVGDDDVEQKTTS